VIRGGIGPVGTRLGVGCYLLCLSVSVCVPAEAVENRNAARRWKNEAAD